MTALTLLRDLLQDKACFLCGEESRLPICTDCTSAFRRCDENWSESHLLAGTASGFSAYWYEGTLRQAVLQMKVQGEYQLATQLAGLLIGVAASLRLPESPLFVPVPRYGEPARVSAHQFPQVACNALAQAFGGDSGDRLLRKTRRTALQTQLTDEQRLLNPTGALSVGDGAAAMIQGRTVVIVDDVLTTGATVRAATAVILEARPHQCLYLTLARSRATIRAGL
ncbi:MAG: ComF family protein [Candidatus Cryosericum sp.]